MELMIHRSDRELITLKKAVDKDAHGELFGRYGQQAVALSLRKEDDEDLALDIGAWISVIVKYKVIDRFRLIKAIRHNRNCSCGCLLEA